MTTSEKVAYLKGLMEGMKFDTETDEGKILSTIVDILGDMAEDMEDMASDLFDLGEDVDAISDDLSDVEDYLVGDDWDDAVLLGNVGRNLLRDLRTDRVRVHMAVFEAELVGHRAEDLVLADRPAGNEDVQRRLVLGFHGLRGRLDLFMGQEAALDQDLQHVLVVASHLCRTLYRKCRHLARRARW